MSQPRIALVTARAARGLDEDLPPLIEALERAGAAVAVLDWDDAEADWAAHDIAVLRSTWDYTQRLPEFLAWVERAATRTTLLNPPDIVRWNTDKHYLGELEGRGVAIVTSAFVEPGEDAAGALVRFIDAHGGGDPAFEFVVKPCVGAGSRDAQRHGAERPDAALAHLQTLLDAGRSALLQPYLARVDEHGETALLWFNGEFSHAIRKGPLLRRNEAATRALFAAEHITARVPSPAELALARETLAAIPSSEPLLYARVDLIQHADGSPRLLELELSEPSLFFGVGAGSADRFAAAVLARLQAVRTT
jgi:glutathione synthase/RimK-type ligase-like ATP-grasp enzyme